MKDNGSIRKGKDSRKKHGRKLIGHLEEMDGLSVYGGLGMLYQLARNLDFHKQVDSEVKVLKIKQQYTESDHLFNLLGAHFIGVGCIEDTAQLKDDCCYRQLLDGKAVTSPSTMGDFMRRFKRSDLNNYKAAMSSMQEQVWQKLTAKQRREASLDLDSRVCPVYGDKKRGSDFSYKGTMAYHPEMLSLAETSEWLDCINRSGNETSGAKGAYLLGRNLEHVKKYFSKVTVRGDTKFGRTDILELCRQQKVRVCVCWPSHQSVVKLADELPENAWRDLDRGSESDEDVAKRKKRPNLRRRKAHKHGYTDKKLKREQVAEFTYQPTRNKKKMSTTYRMVAIRKQIEVAGKTGLFDQYEYRFILSDRYDLSLPETVRYAYRRCNQENLIEQAKNGVSAFRMPTGNLLANEVWMTTGMLAHNFKSWMCLLGLGRKKLGWEWKRFRLHFVYFAARVTKAARQLHLWINSKHSVAEAVVNALPRLAAGGG